MMSTVTISATACVMMAKYTPPTRRLNMAKLMSQASSVGTAMTAASENGRLLKGSQNRSEEHTSELQSQSNLVCRLLLEKKKKTTQQMRAGARKERERDGGDRVEEVVVQR